MENKKTDRRVRRTRKMLKDSLISLMQEKEFENISVKDVTERADLNRGTFYLHYQDTHQLLADIEEEALEQFREMLNRCREAPQKGSLMPMLVPLIDYVSENADICRILFRNSAAIDFTKRLQAQINETGREILEPLFPEAGNPTDEYFFEFITSGLIALMARWLNSGRSISREQLADIADKAVLGTARSVFKGDEK
ncbi:MAG: TetR/AcrR family transcriptional regulator C-terminal domain-containing protein [Eubacteriales bacterium]|nr:TetR/AcrR family transcriptional regulator C-terminal domain-containing protein [Eubacteriales bacterium]